MQGIKPYSDVGLKMTELFEGCRLEAYQDQVGVWTIGYGHTKGVVKGMKCTQEQAESWLMDDVLDACGAVMKLVKVPLTQNQYDALVDFVFNLGATKFAGSTLLKKLNAGDYVGASEEFKKWCLAGGQKSAGLLRRRNAEAALFKGK